MPRLPLCAVLLALACGCAAASSFTKPEGDGGWGQQRRAEELVRAAATAGVAAADAKTAAQAEPSPSRPLTLGDALAMAARHNRTIAVAEQSVEMAAGEVGVARSALLPKTSVQGGYNWYSDPLTNSVDVAAVAVPVNITIREQDFASVSAAVRLAIDISGELRHGLRAAQASYRAEKARAWATTLTEQRAVVQSYLGVLQAERLREVTRQTVSLYERQLADAEAQFHEGRLTKNGVLVVQVVLSSARQRLLRGDVEVARLRRALNKVVGLPIDAATDVADLPGRPSLPNVEDVVADANANSPALAALLEEAQSVDEKATALTRARFPRVAATTGYDATTARTSEPREYASAGVGVQWDLGSDLARESEIARLQHAATRTRAILDRSARELEELVRAAHDAERERLAAADASEVAVTQAEENLRIRREQFGVGRATSEDVLDAASLLARERARLATARYQAYARRAELQQLMGRPLDDLAPTRPAPDVAMARPSDDLARTRPPDDSAQTRSLDDLAQTRPPDDIAPTRPAPDVAMTRPSDDLAQTRSSDDVAPARPTPDVAMTRLSDDLAQTRPPDDIAPLASPSEPVAAQPPPSDTAGSLPQPPRPQDERPSR